MKGEVNLLDALQLIEEGSIKERLDALLDIKHVLRYNQNSAKPLGDLSFLRIYDVLFRLIVKDQSTWMKSKAPSTKTSVETRLSACASTIRLAVEVGVQTIKLRTVKAIFDHIAATLPLSTGGLCTPIALDYAKCIRTVMSYQPHVEHLSKIDWENAALFCIKVIKIIDTDATQDDHGAGNDFGSTAGTAVGLSHMSSRSYAKESVGSQGLRSLFKQVAEEVIETLAVLTAAPNAAVPGKASVLLWALIDFFKGNIFADTIHRSAFSVINNILAWTTTEDITLTQQITPHLILIIKLIWLQKMSPKDEMMSTLLHLRPFLLHVIRHEDGIPLRKELNGLLEAMRTDYGRVLTTREQTQMRLEDIRLEPLSSTDREYGLIGTAIFQLRSAGPSAGSRAERDWAIVHTMAYIHNVLNNNVADESSSDDDEGDRNYKEPRKRQRRSDDFEDLLSLTANGTPASRICALQTVTLLTQQMAFSPEKLSRAIDSLSASCGEDQHSISSWAILALAGFSSQASSNRSKLAFQWSSVWQLASRAMGNPATCRAACYLLFMLQRLRLVPHANFVELGQTFTHSMGISGPSIFADSVAQMLQLVINESRQLSPAITSAMAESILAWLLRIFTPSRFEDKSYASTNMLYEVTDMTQIITTCLNHESLFPARFRFNVWGSFGQTWLACKDQQELISYLLLLPTETNGLHQSISIPKAKTTKDALLLTPRISCETLLLNHLSSDLQRTLDLWKQWMQERPKQISLEMFRSLCLACTTVCYVVHGGAFRDSRRIDYIQKQTEDLLSAISNFSSDPVCEEDKIDAMLAIFSQTFNGFTNSDHCSVNATSKCEKILCRHIALCSSSRQKIMNFNSRAEDYDMDLDDDFDSQDSRQISAFSKAVGFKNDHATAYSNVALRESVMFYANIVVILDDSESPSDNNSTQSSRIVDHVLSLPETDILFSRKVLSSLPQRGLLLSAGEAERLLDFCSENILQVYSFERSEVAIGAILDIMSSLTPVLTDRENESLFELGIDLYNWLTTTALTGGVLSPNVQKRVARLLIQLCHVNTDYGADSDVPSVRTSLFKLLQHGNISLSFHVAHRISTIFGLFVLSTHEKMFDDLQSSLPADVEWVEGMAMRLLFLSKLASAWHSLLRHCIYYIFETAGRVKSAALYAAYCISDLTVSLKFSSPRKLFRLFSSQLLHTWLESGSLSGLPYATFQYSSLNDLLRENQLEIVAQLVMRGSEEGMHVISTALNLTNKELAKRAFAKSLAYSIGWDISSPKNVANTISSEARLRALIDSKEEFRRLALEQFPSVLGQFYLVMQQPPDDTADMWLENKPLYASAAKALQETVAYSHSSRPLPSGPQPSFKRKHLCEQIERLCRRTGQDPIRPWNASSFSLAARMILDAIDDSLGPLHVCLMLRKLRVLICMAGDTAVSGFPLEMLVHSVRPFLAESECADDALGILHYLLGHGQAYLRANNPSFAYGTVTIISLQMKQHSVAKQDSTTQESQHLSTVKTMQKFQLWLVEYLKPLRPSTDAEVSKTCADVVDAIAQVRLPGNAQKNSAESALLLILIHQHYSHDRFLQRSDCVEALSLLVHDFVTPASRSDDCLADDSACADHADGLWDVLKVRDLHQNFMIWVAGALGRAYASTGKRRRRQLDEHAWTSDLPPSLESVARSQSIIARQLSELISSRDRFKAGLADFTLRKALLTLKTTEEALLFEQMLPEQIITAIADGTYGYDPSNGIYEVRSSINEFELACSMEVSASLSDDEWSTKLAINLCLWGSSESILPVLPAIVENVPGFASDLLPPLIHIVLAGESDKKSTLRTVLSRSMVAHFTSSEEIPQTRLQFFLKLLLYLKGLPLPGESTNADRWRWLDVDLLLAADTAARCNMPTAALLFAESATPTLPANRRASSRTSMSQLEPVDIPDELLLSIFKQVDEPDSFYGVQQPASLNNVLDRLDYEEDGLKSLMFRSAQMDSSMRSFPQKGFSDASGMIHSLSVLNLNSLTFTLLSGTTGNIPGSNREMLHTAQALQQWDLMASQSIDGETATSFLVFQELNRASNREQFKHKLRNMISRHVNLDTGWHLSRRPSHLWCNTLASLTEINEVVESSGEGRLSSTWRNMLARQHWVKNSPYEDSSAIITNRQTLFSVLAKNTDLRNEMHVSLKSCKKLEAESFIKVSQYARSHGIIQEALSAATQLSSLGDDSLDLGLSIDGAAKLETASVLWIAGETTASVKMLRDTLDLSNIEQQDVPVGRSGLLAQLAHQLAEARLEKPDAVLNNYLTPAIKHLQERTSGHEAGNVFHEFASFCDQQLQSPGNIEDFDRISKLRQKKLEEVEALESLSRTSKKTGDDKRSLDRSIRQAKQWFAIDDVEYQRLKKSRDTFVQQSLQNYMLALHASDEHDICVLRFFALWLENSDVSDANAVVTKHLPLVPSWKFVVLLNQLMSRLEYKQSTFQISLKNLATRLCSEHPYHSLHHLYASTRKPAKDGTAYTRYEAATAIRQILTAEPKKGDILKRMFYANGHYNYLAHSEIPSGTRSKMFVKDFGPAHKMASKLPDLHIPPATISLSIKPDGNYDNVPVITKFSTSLSIMTGLSKPKSLTAYATDGKPYKQLFKGGNDDLRQDAIMEQVFEEVSKMLRNHKATRKRDLHVRTYKVIPLSPQSGIMEFVANSIPINDFLEPAHLRYHPHDLKPHAARQKLAALKDHSANIKVKEYRKICEHLHPVLRHFFFERFHGPDEWFEKRTAYTRTTAAISILGYILGLGDRHCHNILLDEKSGEVVHIDLGVAFEAGRILPVPELVPFRLTRDIVDGMGITKTEGIFRRCCEFTMDALREDKNSIMTLLNVLRYDPLYTWTVSPLRAKRMQDAQETERNGAPGGPEDETSSKKREQEAGEADRALSIVEKKLSKTLSTAAAVNELIQQATDERNLGTLFQGWAAYL